MLAYVMLCYDFVLHSGDEAATCTEFSLRLHLDQLHRHQLSFCVFLYEINYLQQYECLSQEVGSGQIKICNQ